MSELPEPPCLVRAVEDFDAFVADLRDVHVRWDVVGAENFIRGM